MKIMGRFTYVIGLFTVLVLAAAPIQLEARQRTASTESFHAMQLRPASSQGLQRSEEGMERVVSSVVTIRTKKGHGSGFVISDEGYLLTNAHVVGKERDVEVLTTAGNSIPGKVLRSHKKRDVALIKVDEDLSPPALSIRRQRIPLGSTVFAIGSPMDEEFFGSVSAGVVSSHRQMEGQNYLQSDVTIMEGSSGGPLVDRAGEIVGMCDFGIQVNEGMIGLNFFIPILDALETLNITL